MRDSEIEPLVAQADRALKAGITALLPLQQPDGSFLLLQRHPRTLWWHCHPLFGTVSVLLAAGSLMPKQALSRAVAFVLRCRRMDGLWEFDPAFGIPPDVDDTACAMAVAARYGESAVGMHDAALLRSFWRADGGPFQTWRGAGVWSERDRDDAVVNCNVLHALATLGVPGTATEVAAVQRLVQQSVGGCRYYCSPTTIAYAAQRAGLPLDALPAAIVARPRPGDEVLPSAQWLSTVRHWDTDLIANLLAAQTLDGSWPTEAWFTGAGNPVPVWGSRGISTALCVEALDVALTSRRTP
jgi:hypothetical protein